MIKKVDGSKFGKTESGNVWLDKSRTSPYKFYQFWLNTSDEDAFSYIKIFTFLSKEKIEQKIKEHKESPHLRLLQKIIAEEAVELKLNDLYKRAEKEKRRPKEKCTRTNVR